VSAVPWSNWLNRPTRPCRTKPTRRAAAFTLLEVLAALMLLAIVLPVVLRGISMATQLAAHTRFRDQAVTLCEARLAEVIANQEWQDGDAVGDFSDEELWGPDASRYVWEQEVDDWETSSIKQVTVHVIWQQRNQEQVVTLSTLVHSEGL